MQYFHARILNLVAPEAIFVPELDNLLTKNDNIN